MMLSYENPPMQYQGDLQVLWRSLESADVILQEASDRYPVLQKPGRAFGRLGRAVRRPLRLAILGESNSGKTSLANLLVGGVTLPATPVANTRLPTLLQFARAPSVSALDAGGARIALSPASDVELANITRLEVGLPSQALRWLEILDFPGGANPILPTVVPSVLRHGTDSAIWTTVATQAWRSSEQMAWTLLPPRIRSRGLLIVTHCDLIERQEDFASLYARLETAAKPHFRGLFFIGAQGWHLTGSEDRLGASALRFQVEQLAKQFLAERLEKAVTIARRMAGQTLGRLGLPAD